MENVTNNIDLVQLLSQTFSSLFQNLFSSIDNNLYPILDDITFLDTSLLKDSYFEKLLGTNSSSGILLIANSFILGFLLYYGVRLFLSHYTTTPVMRPYQFLFKFILIILLMNSSYFFCEQFLSFTSLVSSSIRNIGEELFHKEICFSGMMDQMNSIVSISSSNIDLFSLDGILKMLSSLRTF